MAKPPVSYGNALKLTPLPADPVTEAPERPVQED